MYQVTKKTDVMMTRDGVKLVSDIYLPVTDEKLPILLMRQPYGKSIASTVVYAHPIWYAQQGYIVVIQDVRGRGASEGEFKLFETEIEDGYDTLDWVANLPEGNGKVGMYGFSYQGMTQLYCAISRHPALKTICPAMIAYNLYTDWAYENGAFCYQLNLAWAIQLAAETARLKQDISAYKLLFLASKNLPIYELPSILEEILRKYCPSNFYFEWLKHDRDDEYWQKLSPKSYFQEVDLPMLHIGGWFDAYLRGTLNLYEEMSNKSQYQQHLIVGVWSHLPWGNTIGQQYYTSQANNNINELQITWFNKYLKGIDEGNIPKKNIQLFQMGSNKWIKLNHLPQKKIKELYLNSTGLANLKDNDGKLINYNQKNNQKQQDIIIHDFWRSSPSLGGHSVIPSGSFDQKELDNRSDIITYTSDFFQKEIEIIGYIALEIYLEADTDSFDLSATLSQQFIDGKVYNFSQGYIRINNHQVDKPIKFFLQPTCIKIQKNTALRLSLRPANFPSYNINYGSKNDYQPITIKIFSGQLTPSKLTFFYR